MSTKCLKSKTSFSKTDYMKVFCFCSPAQFYISATILYQIRGFIWSLNIKDGDRAITIVLMVTGSLNSIYRATSTKNCVAALLILFFFRDLYSYFSCNFTTFSFEPLLNFVWQLDWLTGFTLWCCLAILTPVDFYTGFSDLLLILNCTFRYF